MGYDGCLGIEGKEILRYLFAGSGGYPVDPLRKNLSPKPTNVFQLGLKTLEISNLG